MMIPVSLTAVDVAVVPRRFALFFLAVFAAVTLQGQQLHSLLNLEKTYVKDDSIRAKLLYDIARRYNATDPAAGMKFAEKGVQVSARLTDKKFLANALSALGSNSLLQADYPKALDNYQKALEINEQTGNIQGQGNNYNNIGLVYYSIDYPRALEYYQKTLRINERTGNKNNLANCLGNIGNIYNELQDYASALEYYEKALAISENLGNLRNVAGNLVNIGNVYSQLKNNKNRRI